MREVHIGKKKSCEQFEVLLEDVPFMIEVLVSDTPPQKAENVSVK